MAKAKESVITWDSPLEKWPGAVELPHPDEFSGLHWQTWKDGVNKPARQTYALTHLYCYTGLELIASWGKWQFNGLELADVQAWESAPDEERIKLVAWLGRSFQRYMDGILDPKG